MLIGALQNTLLVSKAGLCLKNINLGINKSFSQATPNDWL